MYVLYKIMLIIKQTEDENWNMENSDIDNFPHFTQFYQFILFLNKPLLTVTYDVLFFDDLELLFIWFVVIVI